MRQFFTTHALFVAHSMTARHGPFSVHISNGARVRVSLCVCDRFSDVGPDQTRGRHAINMCVIQGGNITQGYTIIGVQHARPAHWHFDKQSHTERQQL